MSHPLHVKFTYQEMNWPILVEPCRTNSLIAVPVSQCLTAVLTQREWSSLKNEVVSNNSSVQLQESIHNLPRLFDAKAIYVALVSFPSSDGIDPVSSLSSRNNSLSCPRFPSELGMGPSM